MPDIIDPHPDYDETGIFREYIVIHSQIKIIYLIASDTGPGEGVLCGKTFLS
jgi:hypothetical protein